MKLEPVYLVQPDPAPPPRAVSRRALIVGAVVAAAGGAIFGVALRRNSSAGPTPAPGAMPPLVEWAAELQAGDPEQLLSRCSEFLAIVAAHPTHLSRLEPGLLALADRETADSRADRRRRRLVLDVLESMQEHCGDSLLSLTRRLRSSPR
ncbi:MAG: hypothetical protein IT457_07040 [Planctomycetes bacterium]|nr:hypothetical protein [Planctomycetota bacterium]